MAIILYSVAAVLLLVPISACIKTALDLPRPRRLVLVSPETSSAYAGLGATAVVFFALALLIDGRLMSFEVVGVKAEIQRLNDRLDSLESSFATQKKKVFDATNWSDLEFEPKPRPGGYWAAFDLGEEPIEGSVFASRGSLYVSPDQVEIEGTTIRLPVNPTDFSDMPLVVRYHGSGSRL